MPRHRSPARVAKERRSKAKAKAKVKTKAKMKEVEEEAKVKHNWPRMKKGHVPSHDSIIRQLSHELTNEMIEWWGPFRGHNGVFASYKRGRGDPNGVAGWLRHMYISEWWDVHYPDAKGASNDDKLWFLNEAKQQKVRRRAIAHDAYREEEPEAYKAAVEEWKQANSGSPLFPKKWKISYSIYTGLANQRKHKFTEKAIAKVKDSRQFARITDPKKLAKFTQEYRGNLKRLLECGFECGGIDACLLLVYQTEEGKMRVTHELTEGIQDYSELSALAECMNGLKDFLEAANKFQGGVSRLMWKELKAALKYYFDRLRLLKVEDLVIDDLSNLSKRMVIIWLTFFMACLAEVIPPGERFQFRWIIAGPSPIHPSESQETSRKQIERDGKLVYVLVFEDYVDKCHQVGRMTYKQPAIDYANHVAFGTAHTNAVSAPPARWLLLPSAGPNVSAVAFSEEEFGLLTSLASYLPATSKTRVITFIEVITTYQEHLPATHPLGIWLHEEGIPLVFARTPQVASCPWVAFWLPHDYFLPPGVGKLEGTLYFFEVCQDELHDSDMMLHKPSKTFYGSYTSVVSMGHTLIQIYLNCLAVRGDFKPPEAAPAGYDTSRFNIQEHDRIVGWIDKWTSTIKQHTKILSETSTECKAGLAGVITQPTSKDPDGESSGDSDLDSDSDSGLDSFHPNTSQTPVSSRSPSPSSIFGPSQLVAGPSKSVAGPSKSVIGRTKPVAGRSKPPRPLQPTPVPSKTSKGKQRKVFTQLANDEESEDEDEGEGVDYEGLDITLQDGKSSDEEGWDQFNERILDDDIFPPDDSIGVLERYGFRLDFKLVPNGAQSCHVPTSEDIWTPEMGGLWGGFPELVPYKAPRLSRADTIMRQLIALGKEATRASSRWESYNEENSWFSQGLRQWSENEASRFMEAVRPLVQFILTQPICWLRAQAMASNVFDQWRAMSYILRKAINLFATAKCYVCKGAFPGTKYTAADMIDRVMKTKLLVVQLSFTCRELRAWHQLSSNFMQTLKGN
ncbi:hypothetical protein FRC11_009002, partial [Ceratobasidium sp. 423]